MKNNQKTVLSTKEEQQIITAFNNKEEIEDLSVTVSYDEIASKNYSFSAGQYFDVKMEYIDISEDQFKSKMNNFEISLNSLFEESRSLESHIIKQLKGLKYEDR